MARVPKTLSTKDAYALTTGPNNPGGGGGGGNGTIIQSGPLFLQPLNSFDIDDAIMGELGALTVAPGDSASGDGYTYWWSVVVADLTSFSIRAAPYIQAGLNAPGNVRIAISRADVTEMGPTIRTDALVEYSDAVSFSGGTRGYIQVQWDATSLAWEGPYLIAVGIQNTGSADASDNLIQGLATVQAEIWNVNSLIVSTPTTPIPGPTQPGGTGGSSPTTPSGWVLEGFEDFDTDAAVGSFGPNGTDVPAAYSGVFTVYEEGWLDSNASTNGGLGRYSPTTVLSVENSLLRKYLHMENGTARVAAIAYGPDQTYGRYAIRFRTAPVSGYKVAYLLWPGSEVWPRDGEIDFPEGSLNGNIEGYVHYMNGVSGSDQAGHSTEVPMSPDWHTCVIEWTASYVRFYLDDVLIGETTERIPSTPMHWVIQTETNIGGTQPTAFDVGYLEIDWIAYWSQA